ncbi:MAG: ABC transporter ATP-binding protein [Rhodospirillales bacterium]|nr:ABC transporter ATP-binding protein [Rhodospirillales bacterium]
MSSEVAIWVDGVSKRYEQPAKSRKGAERVFEVGNDGGDGQLWTLKDVSFRVYKGETLGIIGRNGAGKTTLLRVISNITQPTSGSVKVSGSIAPVLALQSGFNPQFTGRENVYLKCAIMGLSRKETDNRIEDILDFANIHEFIDRPLRTYSNGMRARLAFAVAFNAEPEILVIDEVLAVGDETFRRKCIARIAALKENGTTILFVSHSPPMVLQLCDRAILLDKGELLVAGDPKLIVSSYQRFVYAPHEERSKVRADLLAQASNGAPAAGVGDAIPSPETADPSPKSLPSADFDPALVPQSTTESIPQGARIIETAILDQDDRRVNLLSPRQAYKLTLTVVFPQPGTQVRYKMIIKTVEGLEVAGAESHPQADNRPFVDAGTKLVVTFPFVTRLAPGTYYVDAGIVGKIENRTMVLHRITDAVAFRVAADPDRPIMALTDISAGPVREVAAHHATNQAGAEQTKAG